MDSGSSSRRRMEKDNVMTVTVKTAKKVESERSALRTEDPTRKKADRHRCGKCCRCRRCW